MALKSHLARKTCNGTWHPTNIPLNSQTGQPLRATTLLAKGSGQGAQKIRRRWEWEPRPWELAVCSLVVQRLSSRLRGNTAQAEDAQGDQPACLGRFQERPARL